MDIKALYSKYLLAFGLKKTGDVEASSALVQQASRSSAQEQFAVALGIRDADEKEYDADSDTECFSIYNFHGFRDSITEAFEDFDT